MASSFWRNEVRILHIRKKGPIDSIIRFSCFAFTTFLFQFKPLFQDIIVFVLQAEKASWNSIGIYKISNISGKRRELLPSKPVTDDTDMDSDSSDSDEDDEGEENGGYKLPVWQVL